MSDDLFNKQTAFTLPDFPAGQVTDQGDRGTCVAVSVIKALEYAVSTGEQFSPQFLYACCKAQAGKGERAGLTLQNAFDCIKQYGIALNKDCPYNKAQISDEAQISAARLKEIKTRNFDHPLKMLLTPQNVNEYKKILSGQSGIKPVPIITGIRFFDNMLPDGTIHVPGSFDHELQPHAILIYGWKDTPHDPVSRGYFLAQNSWGNVPQLKIQYEYMEQFAMEAGYTEIEASTLHISTTDGKTGPDMPGKAKVCNDNKVLAAENEFFGLQKQNMRSDRFSYPDIHSPFHFWEKASQYVPETCLTPLDDAPVSFAEYLKERGTDHLNCKNIRVYRITAKPGKYYTVISTFLSRADEQKITAGDLGLFYDYMETYGPNDQPLHTFMIIGGYPEFDPTCQPLPNPTVILCERKELQLTLDDPICIWKYKCPDSPWNMFTYDFILHWLPCSYHRAVKLILDKWPEYQSATIAGIKKKLTLPEQKDIHEKIIESEVDKIFLTEYPRFGKNKQGEIEIRDKTALKFRPCKRFVESAAQLKLEFIIGSLVKILCGSLIPLIVFSIMDLMSNEKFNTSKWSIKFLVEVYENYVNSFGGGIKFWIYFTCKFLFLILLWVLGCINMQKRLKLEYNIK